LKTFTNSVCLIVLLNIAVIGQGITIGSGTTFTGGSTTVTLSGNWTNSGTFTAGTSNVIFNGSSGNQTITNSGGETFNNLTVNKIGGDVQLSNNITVNGTLTLTSGDVDLNDKTITLGSSATLSETTGNTVKGTTGIITTTRSINAPSSNNIGGMGAELTSSADLGSTIITRGHTAQTGDNNTGITRYFDITPTTNTGLNATLVFHYDDSELNSLTESELILFKSTDNGSSWTQMGGTVNTSENFVTLPGIDGFSRWTLGASSSPIPVELTSFTANVNNNGSVVLNWSTATEVNNQMFKIERRSKESQFITIGHVEGYGTTTEPQVYSYIDNTVEPRTYYYRLKQIDFSGQYEYSDEIEIEVNGPLTFGLEQNYPNPFNPSTLIKYSVPENGFVNLSVHNLVGEEVRVLVNETVDAGFYEVAFNAANLPSGTYFYRLQAGNTVQVKKMILLK